MQYTAKTIVLAMSIVGIMMIFVISPIAPALAQTIPTSSNLVKRDFSVMDDQHTTASYGNSKVCGDHLCVTGEWTQLQATINKAQISPPTANSTKSVSISSNVTTTVSTNSTIPVPTNATTQPAMQPTPIPTPPSYVCTAVKAVLGNTTAADTVAKVMSDLGCSS